MASRPQTAGPSHHDIPPPRPPADKFYQDGNAPPWINDLTLNKPGERVSNSSLLPCIGSEKFFRASTRWQCPKVTRGLSLSPPRRTFQKEKITVSSRASLARVRVGGCLHIPHQIKEAGEPPFSEPAARNFSHAIGGCDRMLDAIVDFRERARSQCRADLCPRSGVQVGQVQGT